jgi:pimeloyl-ACP methyl ester carboxylesterase
MKGFAESAGCRLAYELQGEGPPALFIQGVGVHGRGWQPQLGSLAGRFSGLTFDNRGLGGSHPAGGDISIPQMACDSLAVMDAAGFESAHVVGHSMGGLIALELALTAKARVRSLSLMCTFAGGKAVAPLTPRMIWWGLRSQLGTRRMRRRGFLNLLLSPQAVAGADLEAMAAEVADLFGHDLADAPKVQSAQLRAVHECERAARLGELAGLPTLILSGAHDPIAPPAAGRQLAGGIPGARYVEFADASHGLPITHAEAVNRLLFEHFASVET